VISFLLPKKWEVDAIIQPSKFFIQTEAGRLEEIIVVDPNQIASEINEATYTDTISNALNINRRNFPKLRAVNLRGSKLVRVIIRENDVEKAKQILNSLFNQSHKDYFYRQPHNESQYSVQQSNLRFSRF